jgi:type I restriction enzyme S subunit
MKPVTTTGRWRVPWIEALPDGWRFLSAKRLFQARPELASVDEPQLAATQAYGVIEQAEYERRVGRKVTKLNKNLDKRRLVKRDDFIISMRSFEGGLERAWAEGGIRSSYIVLKPTAEISVGYYQHLFKSQPYIQGKRCFQPT